ncbi:DUF2878 domain-containing protein [Neptuniibacter halophilus]|uniref:DUF2878 domain-containing protein n=1 Tax=Neptuniibacter halophilus TaxID=651666 RepID=UPI002573218B|nr:DUF2878 domain-containing protein [Neptuniibacter halophilus]
MSANFWINLIGFQMLWWMSILLGDSAHLPVVLLLLGHFLFHPQADIELLVVSFTALTGFCVDLLLTLGGFFYFDSSSALPPLWLLLLWVGFCCTLRQSLSYFSGRYLLASCAGAVAGSSTYLAAVSLGAVSLSVSWWAGGLVLLFIWALLFPALMLISDRVEKRYAMQNV